MGRIVLLTLLAAAVACAPAGSGLLDDPEPEPILDDDDATGVISDVGDLDPRIPEWTEPDECLGTVYPDRDVIDPDDPNYAGDGYSADEVDALFAQGAAEGSDAYLAYVAAAAYPDLLECAWCACSCHVSAGHESAVDCFKDMHGFL